MNNATLRGFDFLAVDLKAALGSAIPFYHSVIVTVL